VVLYTGLTARKPVSTPVRSPVEVGGRAIVRGLTGGSAGEPRPRGECTQMANPTTTVQPQAEKNKDAKKPGMTDAQRAAAAQKLLDSQIRGLEYRTTQVCKALVDMGSSSLSGQIQRYKNVPIAIRQQALVEIEKRIATVKASLEAAKATTGPTAAAAVGVSLRGAAGTTHS